MEREMPRVTTRTLVRTRHYASTANQRNTSQGRGESKKKSEAENKSQTREGVLFVGSGDGGEHCQHDTRK